MDSEAATEKEGGSHLRIAEGGRREGSDPETEVEVEEEEKEEEEERVESFCGCRRNPSSFGCECGGGAEMPKNVRPLVSQKYFQLGLCLNGHHFVSSLLPATKRQKRGSGEPRLASTASAHNRGQRLTIRNYERDPFSPRTPTKNIPPFPTKKNRQVKK